VEGVATAQLTPEQIDACTGPHGAAEFARDLEATMATVGPEPLWEYHPLGLALTDRQAVEVQYQLIFDHVLPYVVSHTEQARAYGDNYVVQEQLFRFNFDGVESESKFTVTVVCDDAGQLIIEPFLTSRDRMAVDSDRMAGAPAVGWW
jgi:hypothetical protein